MEIFESIMLVVGVSCRFIVTTFFKLFAVVWMFTLLGQNIFVFSFAASVAVWIVMSVVFLVQEFLL